MTRTAGKPLSEVEPHLPARHSKGQSVHAARDEAVHGTLAVVFIHVCYEFCRALLPLGHVDVLDEGGGADHEEHAHQTQLDNGPGTQHRAACRQFRATESHAEIISISIN